MATFPNSHNIIDVVIDFQSANPPALNSFMYRDFKSIRSEELLHLLHCCDWSPVSCPDSGVDLRLEHLSQNIMGVVDQLAPLKKFKTLKKDLPPWVDADLRDLYNRREALRKRYKRTRNSALRADFQSLAAVVEQRTQQAKEEFIQSRLFDAMENNKTVWNELRSFGLLSKLNDQLHDFTPGELNRHFAGVSVSHFEQEADLDHILSLFAK